MSKFKLRLHAFMYGRNGTDALCRFILITALVLAAVNTVVRSLIVQSLVSLLLLYAIFRCLSRSLTRRRSENEKYLKIRTQVIQFMRRQKNRIKYRKTKVYKKCPHCKSILCLPRKKGTHSVRCPNCSERFEVHI